MGWGRSFWPGEHQTTLRLQSLPGPLARWCQAVFSDSSLWDHFESAFSTLLLRWIAVAAFSGLRRLWLGEKEVAAETSFRGFKYESLSPGRDHERYSRAEVTHCYSVWLATCESFPSGSAVKNSPAVQEMQETQVRSLGQENPLETIMTTHASILDRKSP